MDIKKVHVTDAGDPDTCLICVRFRQYEPYNRRISVKRFEVAPIETIDDKELSVDEARRLGRTEDHFIISNFDTQDLIKIRDAIDAYVKEKQ